MKNLTIEVSPHLPYKETSCYCEIKTKKEFKVETGRMVKMLIIGNRILVSKETYQEFFIKEEKTSE